MELGLQDGESRFNDESQRRMLESLNQQLGEKISQLAELHKEFKSMLQM